MLGGLKFGKKKASAASAIDKRSSSSSSSSSRPDDSKPPVSKYSGSGNLKLPSGGGIYYPGQPQKQPSTSSSTSSANRDALEALKRGGLTSSSSSSSSPNPATNAIAMRPKPEATSEDLRSSELRRGNLKRKHHQSEFSNPSDEASKKTLQDLVDEERSAKSMDEVYLRNMNRVGSRYKGGEFGSAKGEGNGFDEEHQIDMTMFTDKDDRVTDLKRWEREKQRAQAEGGRLKKVESGSWWWVSSTRFDKTSLLSLGEHTTLGMCPTHLSVRGATYIVPVQHATRFNECDAEVWGEVARFKAGLAKMFKKRGEDVVFVETAKGSMQGRIEALPLKKGTDYKLRFKASMREVLDESEFDDAHNKVITLGDRRVRNAAPKGFDYFTVSWMEGGGRRATPCL